MAKRLFLISNFFVLFALAQPGKEAWHWDFGNKAQLDFSSGAPIVGMGPSLLNAFEGSASLSDPNTGQYLFSVGSSRVFNKNNLVMSNGLGVGNYGCTQGVVIIPKPGSSSLFYVITNEPFNQGSHSIRYSIIDMSLQSGIGAVILKNKPLLIAPTTEKLTAARHCNGTDYWIVTHTYQTNLFYAYLVSSAGIDTIPVISSVGSVHFTSNPSDFEWTGYLKFSPNGKKLALGLNSNSLPVMEIFDFDNSTGVISNVVQVNYPGKWGPYGVCFSPDNTKLYAEPHDSISSWIYQYDVSSNNGALILASETLIAHVLPSYYSSNYYTGGELAGMQLAPDGNIYIARNGPNCDTLSTIHNPNNTGLSCNFQYDGLLLQPGTLSKCGLPNFIDANYAGIQLDLPDVQQCNTFTATTLDAGAGYANYFWSTGASTQTISINSPGKYWVTVTSQQGCTRTDTVNAYLLKSMKLDTLACDTFHADVTQNGVLHYNWFDASHTPIRDFTQSGNYYVDINFISGCAVRDSLIVTVMPSPNINIGYDTAFCKGNLSMDATCNTCSYQWSTGETTAIGTAKSPGTYWVKVHDAYGCTDSDTLIVRPQLMAFDFVMPNIVTPNGDGINEEIDFGKYQFSTFSIGIFNRWGQKVFASEDPNAIWMPAGDEGTYFYVGRYKIDCGVDSRTKEIKGFITVVR